MNDSPHILGPALATSCAGRFLSFRTEQAGALSRQRRKNLTHGNPVLSEAPPIETMC